MKKKVRTGQLLIVLFSVGLYCAEWMALQRLALPYTLLVGIGILFLDLFLISPLKAATAAVCISAFTPQPCTCNCVRLGFSRALFYKSVMLRITIWRKRLIRYTVFLAPSAMLFVISEQLHNRRSYLYSMPFFTFGIGIVGWALLILGVICIEIRLLRYKSAWYLLPFCKSATEAIRASKTVSIGCMEDIVHQTVSRPITNFTFAQWVMHQIGRSRHAYNFTEFTNTDMGTDSAHTLLDGGTHYERA